MTISQKGRYRHGMYGYPVQVELSPEEGEDPVDLTDATALSLSLQRVNPKTDTLIQRDLPLGNIIDSGGGVHDALITWTVLDGDLPAAGQYEMILTVDFGPTQRFIADGKFSVS